MAGGATFLKGRPGVYRNAWRAATEEVRAIVMKAQTTYSANVSDFMVQACDNYVNYYVGDNGSAIPIKTGNLVDSFGVALYKNDTLYHLSRNAPRATKRVRSGFETFEGVGGESEYGNLYSLVSGQIELMLMSEQAHLPSRRFTDKFGRTQERGMITAIMYIAAPYARAVPEKGFWGGYPGVPRNDYYEALEYGFVSLVDELKNKFRA